MTAGASNSPVFDFTSVDFSSIETDLVRYASSRFPDSKWTDFNASNEGRRVIELVSYLGDLLSYRQNAIVRETIIATLIRDQNLRNIGKGYDYTLPSASPARTRLRITISGGSLPLLIPTTSKFGAGSVIFQPDVATNVTSSPYEVDATEGEQVTDALGTSNGMTKQSFVLSGRPVLDGTLTVTVGATPYAQITNITDAEPTDAVYTVESTEDGYTRIVFGDGFYGTIPSFGSAISATYRVGGGTAGNLPIGAINRVVDAPSGVLTVTNITAAEGGGPKLPVALAKILFAKTTKANDRWVNPEDYATAATQVSGVLTARGAIGPVMGTGSTVIIWTVPNNGGELSPALANQIVQHAREKGMVGKRVFPRTAQYPQLLIEVDAFILPGVSAAVVVEKCRDIMMASYQLGTLPFSAAVSLQTAYDHLDPVEQRISGLQRVFIRKFTAVPREGRYTLQPATGTGEVVGITVDYNLIQRREWNITMVYPNGAYPEFVVKERRIGVISGLHSTILEDEEGGFFTNEFFNKSPAWRLRPRGQDGLESFEIAANDVTSITVTGASTPGGSTDLFSVCGVGDGYVVEREMPNRGKIFATTIAAPGGLSGAFTFPLEDIGPIVVGDYVLIDGEQVVKVTGIDGLILTVETKLEAAYSTGTSVEWFWYNENKSVGFTLRDGATEFVIGDTLFVDTYAAQGDLRFRSEDYPYLVEENLTVVGVGGVK